MAISHGWLTATSSQSLGTGTKTITLTNGTAGNCQLHLDPSLGLTPGVESLGSVQHIAISTTPENLERIKASLEERGTTYLGPDRGVTTSIYFKDPDGIQIELIAGPLLTMDGKGLGV